MKGGWAIQDDIRYIRGYIGENGKENGNYYNGVT